MFILMQSLSIPAATGCKASNPGPVPLALPVARQSCWCREPAKPWCACQRSRVRRVQDPVGRQQKKSFPVSLRSKIKVLTFQRCQHPNAVIPARTCPSCHLHVHVEDGFIRDLASHAGLPQSSGGQHEKLQNEAGVQKDTMSQVAWTSHSGQS